MLKVTFLQGPLLETVYAPFTNQPFAHLYIITTMSCQQWPSGKSELLYRFICHSVNNDQVLKYGRKLTPFYHKKRCLKSVIAIVQKQQNKITFSIKLAYHLGQQN